MFKKILFLFFLLAQFQGRAQSGDERAAVIATIQQMFDGMRAGDSAVVSSVFDPSARLQSAFISRDGKSMLATEATGKFAEAVGSPHEQVFDERIWSYDVNIDGNLATAWTEYTFFLGEKMSHCGVNAFQLFKSAEGGWKIIHIADTRRREGCRTEPYDDEAAIDSLLNAWHHAAAVADEDAFFGSMAAGAVYLGTDATERWLRDDMKAWSAKYFERESAWAFTPKNRQVYLSADGRMAWFEELLDTWMGVCRGSGVLQKTAGGWKIRHYNLAVTVPNDLIEGFIELVKNAPEKK
jgi:ketosteroid isomerase-like protein